MTVVDVGAHVGVYSLLAARLVWPHGVVHAIEPQQSALSLLSQSAELNKLPNVKTHCLALGNSDGDVGLQVDQRSLGAFTTAPDVEGCTLTRVARLETFMRIEDVGEVGLMKLDAAGNELAVLQGGQSVLREGLVERIICKLYHPDTVASRFGDVGAAVEIVDFLDTCGYDVVLADEEAATEATLRSQFAAGAYGIPALATRRTTFPR